jgi:short-subunit dehydrogenase
MQDKVVVVVGATGGIGSALVPQLSQAGARLVLTGRDRNRLDALAHSLDPSNPPLTVVADITDANQANYLINQAVDHFGRIDALVNSAGAGLLKQYHKIQPEDLEAMLAVNLKGSFYTSQAAANRMREQGSGHICNLAGILGRHPMTMAAAYCAAKFGVVGFSKCMADELKRFGVKFTLFYLGGVDTPFWETAGLKVDRSKMLSPESAAAAIVYALKADPHTVPLEINLQPESHLFL